MYEPVNPGDELTPRWAFDEFLRVSNEMKGLRAYGPTSRRPSLRVGAVGFLFFDTTLGKPIWWDGSGWVDATGTTA